jgi:ATP-dependent RNA helicase DeaD
MRGRKESRTRRAGERPVESARRTRSGSSAGFQTYRIEVGRDHGVTPGNIVGAIANEAGLESQYIGRIQIFEDHSLVDLPDGMPDFVRQALRKVWIAGRQLRISKVKPGGSATNRFAGGATGKGSQESRSQRSDLRR